MNEINNYPNNIASLYERLELILKEEQNPQIIKSIEDWRNWFQSTNYKLNIELKDNEYLRIYSENGNYALQLWKRDTLVNSIIETLITNFYDIYNSEKTIIFKK